MAPGAAAAAARSASAAASPGAAAAATVDDDGDLENAELERVTLMAERAAQAAAARSSVADGVGPLAPAGDDETTAGYTGGGGGDGDHDDDAAEFSVDDVQTARAAVAAAVAAMHGERTTADTPLDAPPEQIHDVFSAVMGDVFHMMDRPKVPMHHDTKKGYFVSLQQAW